MFIKNIIFVLSLFVLTVSTEEDEERGPQLWSLSAHPSQSTLSRLKSKDLLDVWSTSDGRTKVLIDDSNVERVTDALNSAQINYSVLEKDVYDLVRQERSHREERKRRRKRAANAMDWTSYHSLRDIEGYLGWLHNTLGGKAVVTAVANTDENRTVYVVKVSNNIGANKKKIWIEGGIHAREWISPAAVTYLLHQVATNPEFEEILTVTDWYFVPVLNADGYDYSFTSNSARLWRKNRSRRSIMARMSNRCVGVDLNRNWDMKWGVGASKNPCSPIFQGPQPFSEQEVDGVRKAMMAVQPYLFITMHSYGQSMLYPWGFTTDKPKNWKALHELANVFKNTVAMASNGNTEYVIGGSGEVYGLASGATDDWAYGFLNSPFSYTLELRDKGRHGFELPESQIFDTVNETTVGIYCMVSYLTDTGRCKKQRRNNGTKFDTPPEPRSSDATASARSQVVFPDQ